MMNSNNIAPWDEKHYTIPELAARFGISQKRVRLVVRDREDVPKWGKANRRDGKRDYVNYRIRESQLPDVYRELFPNGR